MTNDVRLVVERLRLDNELLRQQVEAYQANEHACEMKMIRGVAEAQSRMLVAEGELERLRAMEIMGGIAAELVGRIAEMVGARPVFASDGLSQQELLTAVQELAERAEKAEAEVAGLELKWAAASVFVRDVIEACGLEQPELYGTVDLNALLLQVVGRIEVGKLAEAEVEALKSEMAGVKANWELDQRVLNRLRGARRRCESRSPHPPESRCEFSVGHVGPHIFGELAWTDASPPAPSGWQQRIAALRRYSEGEACMYPSPGGKWVLLEQVKDALAQGQNAKDAPPLLPHGALEEAFREGYDFGQADAGFEEVDASGAWSKSGTRQNAKDALPPSPQHAWSPDATGTACAACGGYAWEHGVDGGEVVVACDCGNRDTITLPLTAMPPCSAGCGRRMRVVGVYVSGALPPAPEGSPAKPQPDVVCEHGTAMDVHCCNCHSGFLFDAATCVCEVEERHV